MIWGQCRCVVQDQDVTWHQSALLLALVPLDGLIKDAANEVIIAPAVELREDDEIAVNRIHSRERVHFEEVWDVVPNAEVDAGHVAGATDGFRSISRAIAWLAVVGMPTPVAAGDLMPSTQPSMR